MARRRAGTETSSEIQALVDRRTPQQMLQDQRRASQTVTTSRSGRAITIPLQRGIDVGQTTRQVIETLAQRQETARLEEARAEALRNAPGPLSRFATNVSKCVGGICSNFVPTNIADVPRLQRTQICEWGLTELAENIFKPNFFNMFGPNNTGRRTIRGIWELGQDPSMQCNATILNTLATEENRNCWICGEPTIDTSEIDRDVRLASCDHILPIAQASLFLGLFKSEGRIEAVIREVLGDIPPAKQSAIQQFRRMYTASEEVIKLEYAWSHLKCNTLKEDAVFIKLNEREAILGKVLWEVDKDAIRSVLSRIISNEAVTYRTRAWNRGAWIEGRIDSMINGENAKLKKILDVLGKRQNEKTVHQLYIQSMKRCTLSANPRGASQLNAQVNLTIWELFGEFAERISPSFSIRSYLPGFINRLTYTPLPPEQHPHGQGRTKKPRNKKRNKKTRRVKKH